MTDCLIIGFNDTNFDEYEKMVRSMGIHTGAYKDLNLSFIEYEHRPYRGLDLLSRFHCGDKPRPSRPFNNADFLWPVITYLSSYLHRHGYSYDYVNLFHFEKDKLREKLLGNRSLTVAITTTLYTAPHPILEIVSFIRRYDKDVTIIIGGPYISGQARSLERDVLLEQFTYLGGDIYVICSEGELALIRILDALKSGKDLGSIPNIAFRDGGTFRLTGVEAEYNSLEENMVDYSLFSKEEVGQFVTLRTAKSCPFSCSFCGFPERAGAYKYLSPQLVEKELDAIADIGTVTTLTFLDDTFNVPKQRFKDLLRMMIRNKYGFRWNSFYRSDHGDEETIQLMAEAGCEGVILGVESGSDKILELMNKSARRKHYLKAIPLLESCGIACYASLIVGFPGETLQTVEETIALLEEAKPSYFRSQLWYCDPITPVYRQKEKHGLTGVGFNWQHRTMDVATACDLIERIFLKVENSIWLLQNGFELWSDFYLQRHGMKREQVKQFLRCFDAAIKEKLIFPNKKEPSPRIIDALRVVSNFTQPMAADTTFLEVFSGRNYAEAEKYWAQEYAGLAAASNTSLLQRQDGKLESKWNSVRVEIDPATLASLRRRASADLACVLLSVGSTLMSRLSGVQETVILTSIHSGGKQIKVPLRLHPLWNIEFDKFVAENQRKINQGLAHATYALNIINNPVRMTYLGCTSPEFEIGYLFSDRISGALNLDTEYKHHSDVTKDLKVVFQVKNANNELDILLSTRFSPEVTHRVGAYFGLILAEVAAGTSSLLGEIRLGDSEIVGESSLEVQEHEVFDFKF